MKSEGDETREESEAEGREQVEDMWRRRIHENWVTGSEGTLFFLQMLLFTPELVSMLPGDVRLDDAHKQLTTAFRNRSNV